MGERERSQARDVCEPSKAETAKQRQLRVVAELDENTLYGRALNTRCPATFMSWPNGRLRCSLEAGHRGGHR